MATSRLLGYCMLEAGAVVGAQTNAGTTALMYAAQNGHAQVARVLLEPGAVVGAQDNADTTALMFAAQNGYEHGHRMDRCPP